MTVRFADSPPRFTDVAIVGGGFSGLMCMVHVLRHMPGAIVTVIERVQRPASGPAYGACRLEHLLNVPAGRMGATSDDPGGVVKWLRATGRTVNADEFVPRVLY